MNTLLKIAVGGLLIYSGIDAIGDGVDVMKNGEQSRLYKSCKALKRKIARKKSTVSVDTVDFEVEGE